MKKIIFVIICIFCIPLVVNADYSLPTTYKYEVVITNKDGAAVYESVYQKSKVYKLTKEKITYDTKITVVNENYYKGNYYLEVKIGDEEENKFILAEDVKIANEAVDLNAEDFTENEYKEQYYALFDTKMYKGPSQLYGEVVDVTIPQGTVLDYEYSYVEDNFITMWIYIEYQGIYGWVYCYNGFSGTEDMVNSLPVTVVKKLDNSKEVFLFKELDVYSYNGVMSESTKIGVLPVGTKVKFLYSMDSDIKQKSYYVEYEDIKGWVTFYSGYAPFAESDYAEYVPGEKLIAGDMDLYNYYKDTEPVGILPQSTIIDGYYKFCVLPLDDDENVLLDCYLYIDYEDENYYIYNSSFIYDEENGIYENDKTEGNVFEYITEYNSSNNYEIILKEDTFLYDLIFIDDESRIATIIPKNTTLISNLSASISNGIFGEKVWYYVEYEEYKGWIRISEENAEIKDVDDAKETSITKEENNSLKPIQIGLLCGVCAITITIVSAFIIIKINKVKNKEL